MENISLPLSKSILNRCLMLSAISKTPIYYLPPEENLPNDVLVMKRLLFENTSSVFDVEDAGTVFRFLSAYLAITPGEHRLLGTPRLNSRPIAPLVDALNNLGAKIMYCGKQGEAPLQIIGKKISGGEITLNASASSQFVSALMLIAPLFTAGLKIKLSDVTSFPYLEITRKCLDFFGVESSIQGNVVQVEYTPEFKLKTNELRTLETDWSSAAFWYALCAVTGKAFRFKNLSGKSIQGDFVCVELFKSLGVETTIDENEIQIKAITTEHNQLEFDLGACPDIAPALIVACALKNKSAKFYGLHTLVNKESNRVEVLQTELKKININFLQEDLFWTLIPNTEVVFHPSALPVCHLLTYNDHRIAMAFASIKALNNKIVIENQECVKKSYPLFWNDFFRIFG